MTTPYPPIETYGVVGNLETCALVGPGGSVDWYPVPHVESPSVFAAVLDAQEGGHFRVGPAGPAEETRAYVERTNVVRTEFDTEDGSLQVTDFMPPVEGGGEPVRALFRKAECVDGAVELAVEFAPRPDYARSEPDLEVADGTVEVTGPQELTLAGDGLNVDSGATRATGNLTLGAGDSRWFVLAHDGSPPDVEGEGSPPDAAACERALDRTVEFWREWAHDHGDEEDCVFDGPWHDHVVRSGLALKLLAHADGGAIAAAPTTSLPEEIGGVRNWDYRYSWPRDAAFTVQALAHLGHLEEAGAYFEWFLGVCEHPAPDVQPLYGLHGEVELDEYELDHLDGYRESRPVRVGNAAAEQRQLDVYGELVLALAAAIHHGWELDEDDWPVVRDLVEYVAEVWTEPDSGIWEVRSEPRHFVHSKLMCWVALDRGIALAEQNGWDAPIEEWRTERERVRAEILDRGFDEERNTFVRSYGSDALDATALLIPVVGFLPFDDERVEGTVESIRSHLEREDGLVLRYDGEDGLPGDEGTFTLCSFWLVDVLALSGQVAEARELFETLLSYASPLGLFAEQIDPGGEDGIHLGNFPQAFSHVGLVNTALYLGRVADPETPGPEPVGIWLGEGPGVPGS